MDFDFRELYAAYSNVDLLRITLHPDQYQQEAVKAATDMLALRDITDDERREAGYIIHEPAAEEHITKILFTDRPEAGTDLLGSFDNDNAEKPSMSFLIFFGLIGLYYLCVSYTAGRWFYFFFKYGYGFSYIIILVNLFYLAVIPFALYRFYMRKRGGWYIIFAEATITAVPTLYYFFTSWFFFRSHFHLSFESVFYLMGVIIKPLIFFFLWEKGTADYAGINAGQKKKALLICGGILTAIVGIAYFLSTHQSF